MKKLENVIAIGVGAGIMLMTALVLLVLKPGNADVVETSREVVQIEEESDVSVESTENVEESMEPVETIPGTESYQEFADRVASSNPEDFVISTPVNGKAYYVFDTEVLEDSSWLPDMGIFEILIENGEGVYGLTESNITIHHETYEYDGDVATVGYTVTLDDGFTGNYTLTVDVTHKIIYSDF